MNANWKFVAQTTIPYRGYRHTEEALPGSWARTFEGTGAAALAKAQEVRAAGRFDWVAAVTEGPQDIADEPEGVAFRVELEEHGPPCLLKRGAVAIPYRDKGYAVDGAVMKACGGIAVVRLFEADGRWRSTILVHGGSGPLMPGTHAQ